MRCKENRMGKPKPPRITRIEIRLIRLNWWWKLGFSRPCSIVEKPALQKADTALHVAKENGRNRVEILED